MTTKTKTTKKPVASKSAKKPVAKATKKPQAKKKPVRQKQVSMNELAQLVYTIQTSIEKIEKLLIEGRNAATTTNVAAEVPTLLDDDFLADHDFD